MSPIQITIRSVPDSLAIEQHIIKHFKKLDRLYKRINCCRVVVDVTQKHKHQGKLFSVSIDMLIPGKELVISKKQNQNLYVTIRDGFAAIKKLLEKYAKRKPIHIDKSSLYYDNSQDDGIKYPCKLEEALV